MIDPGPGATATITPRDQRFALRFALAPLLVLALGHVVFELAGFGLPALSESLGTHLLDGQALREVRPLVESRARLTWSTTILLFYAVNLAVIGYSVAVLGRTLTGNGLRLYAIVGVLLCAAVLGHAVYSGLGRNPFSAIYYFTFESLERCGCFHEAELGAVNFMVTTLNLLGGLVPVVLVAACGIVASPAREPAGAALGRLEGQMRGVKTILAGGSALMFAGIVHQVAWLRWPAALVADATVARDIVAFAESLSLYWGTTYTLMLLALYGPIAWTLNRRARAVFERSPESGGDLEPEAWIQKHGLSVAPLRQLPQVLALLAPLLAGPLGSALSGLSNPLALG